MTRSLALLSCLVIARCPGGGGSPDAALDAPPDAATRGYRLASAGVTLDPALGPVFTDPDLAGDVDVVNVHQDFYGVPWDAFAANSAPPPAWAAKMTELAVQAHATGKDIFLALAPLDGDRANLAPQAVASAAGFDVVHGWKPRCYDLATAADGASLRTAYARYVTYMMQLFAPRWVNVAVEVSLFHVTCAAAWTGMVALERDAYDAAKLAAPSVPAFPSIQIDALYGRTACPAPSTADQCYDREYAALADLKRDRFAISTYPHGFVAHPADIPAGYLARAAQRGGERLFIAETGWLATPIVVTDETAQCRTVPAGSPTDQAAYFDRVVDEAVASGVEVITWISNRDFLTAQVMTDCPCTFSPAWCGVVDFVRGSAATPIAKRDAEFSLKAFGTMGIREYTGAPRQPIFDRWTAARARPVGP